MTRIIRMAVAGLLATLCLSGGAAQAQQPAFSIDVKFSAAAEAKLRQTGEKMKLVITYRAPVAPGKAGNGAYDQELVDEEGNVGLGEEEMLFAGKSGRIPVSGKGLKRERLAFAKPGAPVMVDVFVYPAVQTNRSTRTNCAHGETASKTARAIATSGYKVLCKLGSER